MRIYQPLDLLPIGAIFILTLVVLILADEAGFRLGLVLQKRWPDRSESGVGTMVGAALALLGFLLAFLTGMAVTIFNNRLQLVINEANAIGTTYLRAGYLDEPISTDARQLLVEYVDLRLAALERSQLDDAIARSEGIHAELWQDAETLARTDPTPVTALYISSLNEVIDLHAERVNMELGFRVPPSLVQGVFLVAVLTMVLLGVHASYSEKRNLLVLVIMILILATVLLILVDLDRSQQGLLRIPQDALLDLQRQFRSNP